MGRAYKLPEEMRAELAEPLGRVYSGEEVSGREFARLVRQTSMAVTVGDRVTETLGALGRVPEVQVVDGAERRSKREPPEVPYGRLLKVKNPAGTITAAAIDGMRDAFGGRKPVRVLVEGEEDLLAMLAVALGPVASTVFYGQPGEGVVAVKVDGTSKARNRALLAKMGIKGLR